MVNDETTGAQSSAVFCDFAVNGEQGRASCYAKDTTGFVFDAFEITAEG